MSTIISNNTIFIKSQVKSRKRKTLAQIYWNYVARQENQNIYWFMISIIVIPCVYMTISIMAMHEITPNIELYIGASMLVFFANVIIHIAECKSKIFIPAFHLTTAFFVLAPLVAYLINN